MIGKGEIQDPPISAKRHLIRVIPGVRDRLAKLLTTNPEMEGVGYSEFISRACSVAEKEIEESRERDLDLGEAERRVLKHGFTPGCPMCEEAIDSITDRLFNR